MTRRHLMTLRLLLMLADGVAAAVVFVLVSIVRFEADPTAMWSVGIDVGVAAVLFGITWVSVLWAMGLYRLRVRWSLRAEARDIVRATVVVLAITLSTLFVLPPGRRQPALPPDPLRGAASGRPGWPCPAAVMVRAHSPWWQQRELHARRRHRRPGSAVRRLG